MAWDDTPPQADELQSKSWDATPPTPQELGSASQAGPAALAGGGKAAADANFVMEGSPAYPNSRVTDPTINDVSTVAGIPMAAKAIGGLGLRAAGATADALPATANLVPTVGDLSNDMLLKSMGARVGQIKQVGGIEAAREAADVARRAGLSDVFSTERGRRAALQNLTNQEGQQIGALRQAAGNPSQGLLDQVGEHVSGKYSQALPDVRAGEGKDVIPSVNMIKNEAGPNPTHADIAKGITALNKYATGAKQLQPVNAMTDVAHDAAAANDAEIAQALGSDKAQQYLGALKNERGAFQLSPFLEKGAEREAVARGGGRSALMSAVQKVADTGGYRAASKGLDALHGGLTNTPNVVPAATTSLYSYLSNHPEEADKLLKNPYGGQE